MNARERAEKAIREMPDYWGESYEEIINTFEQALIQAEEEVTKREREAFLQIVKAEEEYGEQNQINEYACCARAIKGKIKARSEGEKEKGE